MINLIDKAIERFLRQAVPLPEAAVDVSFDTPDRTWGAAVTRPTVNVFLWEVARNQGRSKAGFDHRVNDSGAVERRRAQPVVDLRYLLTGWANAPADEHQLLGSVLTCVLRNERLPDDCLPEPIAGTTCALRLSTRDERVPNEFWSSLDGRMKPGLPIEVSLPIEVFEWMSTATPAEEVRLSLDHLAPADPTSAGGSVAVGDHDQSLRRRRVSGGSLIMEGRPGGTEPGG